jgi:Plant ATP synthase F0
MIPLSQIFFLGIVFYLLYRFVFNFLVPVFRTTKHVRAQFKNMQDQSANSFQQQYARSQEQPTAPKPSSNNSMGEYIDFEEVKGK